MILGFNEKSGYVPGEPPVWNLLRSLFSTTMEVEEKLKILEGYGVPVTADVEEEVDDMCNLGQGVFEDGLQRGRMQGRQEGRVEGRVEGRKEGRAEGRQLGETETVRKTGLLKEAMTKAGRIQEFMNALGSLKALNRLYAEFGIE